MNDQTLNIIKDVTAALKADSAVAAIVGTRVYTDIPNGVAFPFIRLSVQSNSFSTKTETGMETILQVACFDRKDSIQSVANLREKVYNVLNRGEATVFTNSQAWLCEFTGTNQILKDPDGQTWQAIAQFKIITG